MMARRKLTNGQELLLVRDYEAWEPNGQMTADELAARHGVTRQVMYNVLARHGVRLHSRLATNGAEHVESVMVAMADTALDKLFDRLSAAERRVHVLEAAIENHLRGAPTGSLRQALDESAEE